MAHVRLGVAPQYFITEGIQLSCMAWLRLAELSRINTISCERRGYARYSL